jgi:hypothetical protein
VVSSSRPPPSRPAAPAGAPPAPHPPSRPPPPPAPPREAARPARPIVADITREELAEVVRRIMAADPETDYYLRLLEANTVHPGVSDLIFHPPSHLHEATAERIVDAALDYRPMAAGPGDADAGDPGHVR